MTSVKKQHQKALKGPDEFQVRMLKALSWANNNVKYLAYIAVPVALAIVGTFVWQNVSNHYRDQRLNELGIVQVKYDAEEKTAETKREELRKQIAAIDADIAKQATPPAADKAAPAEAGKADPALTAKKDALQKQIDAVKADHSGSLVDFNSYFAKHEGNPEGWLAGMIATKILADQHKLPEARAALEKVLAQSTSDKFYQVQARFMLIGLLEEQGEFDAGLKEVEAIDKLADEDTKPRVMLAKGRLQMLKKANDEARATFTQLIEKHASSPEAQKARSFQSLLN